MSLFFTVFFSLGLMASEARARPGDFVDVKNAYRTSDVSLVDREGRTLHEWRIDSKRRKLDWVSLADISPAVQTAVLNAEDRRFYSHSGVDWRAILAATVKRITSNQLRGASTISMQLVSMLNPGLRPKRIRRGFWQKWRQITEARALEAQWSKSEILEAYLNLVTYRGELVGISAASRGLFWKHPSGMSPFEGSVLAALIRSPNATSLAVAKRACDLWRNSISVNEFSGESLCFERVSAVLDRPYAITGRISLAPHVAKKLEKEPRTQRNQIVSTLDADLQRLAIRSLNSHLLSIRSQNARDGAVLVIENQTGNVLAYVGNSGGASSRRFVDAIHARRQAGSILKPFLYSLAFENRLITPASLLDDSPLEVSGSRGVYRPGNYDRKFHGLVSARVALASSLNVPAVKTLLLVGEESFVRRLKKLGLSVPQSGEYYGPSLALGSLDVTLWEVTNAYRTLANQGIFSPVHLTPGKGVGDKKAVISPDVVFLVSDILSDRESRSLTFGLENPLATRFWTAVKTGTSKDMRDNWCLGYSSKYTVGVWVGNFSGAPMWNVSGVSGAAPVWVDVMDWLHRRETSQPPPQPKGIVVKKVSLPSGQKDRSEFFLAGTESLMVRKMAPGAVARILSPGNGSIVALDPDIPTGRQRLLLEASPSEYRPIWKLDGTILQDRANPTFCDLSPGRHKLELLAEGSRSAVDVVHFEVRGRKIEKKANLAE